ncbi:MAG TPA: hypothetical protein VH165_29920 [Kofleriaceae bacterium]|nr:hypothetical protein [Kofleriaceae bacterium]
MKKQLNEKLNAKAAKVLVKGLDEKALESVTGGLPTVGECPTCGLLAKTTI